MFLCRIFRLQSFAIPGSIFLTILSGYLFPFPIALTLVCVVRRVGLSGKFVLVLCLWCGRLLLSVLFGWEEVGDEVFPRANIQMAK